jgi:hypothetical protein
MPIVYMLSGTELPLPEQDYGFFSSLVPEHQLSTLYDQIKDIPLIGKSMCYQINNPENNYNGKDYNFVWSGYSVDDLNTNAYQDMLSDYKESIKMINEASLNEQ